MSEISKPKIDPASLPETFLTMLKCSKCKKYLRPPIWIICDSGHNVCDICLYSDKLLECPASPKCKLIKEKIRNSVTEDTIKVCLAD